MCFSIFLNLLPNEGIVLDLGANIGVTSYHLARKLPKSTVFAFEPLEINMEILKRVKKRFLPSKYQRIFAGFGRQKHNP